MQAGGPEAGSGEIPAPATPVSQTGVPASGSPKAAREAAVWELLEGLADPQRSGTLAPQEMHLVAQMAKTFLARRPAPSSG